MAADTSLGGTNSSACGKIVRSVRAVSPRGVPGKFSSYRTRGTATIRPDWKDALERVGLLRLLAEFDPHLIGTLSLELGMATSDIDVAVFAADPNDVAETLWNARELLPMLSLRRWTGDGRPLIGGFHALGWEFEVFAASCPVQEQVGWRHFDVERRLLAIGGDRMRRAVRRRRTAGAKTEPAFAGLLRLPGDPYAAMSELFKADERKMVNLVAAALRREDRSCDDKADN